MDYWQHNVLPVQADPEIGLQGAADALDARLRDEAVNGWELVNVVPYSDGSDAGFLMLLKRRLG